MKLGIVKMTVAVTIIVLAMLAQIVPASEPGGDDRQRGRSEPIFGASSSALAQDDDNEDEDNEDEDNDDSDNDNEDGDNEDEDNDDGDNDNEDDDNEDEDADNDDGDDNNHEADDGDAGAVGTSFSFDASVTEASGTSTGGDSQIGLPADRVLVKIFPWMPADVTVTIRLADPSIAANACTVIGDLVFNLEADDGTGYLLTALPAEVNLSARGGGRAAPHPRVLVRPVGAVRRSFTPIFGG